MSVKKERVHIHKLQYIVQNWDQLPLPEECKRDWTVQHHLTGVNTVVNPIKTLNAYLNGVDIKKGFRKVSYHQSASAQKFGNILGRRYVKDNLGLQSINHIIRNTISGDFYDDIDMVNCHNNLLLQLCKKKGWFHNFIEYYSQHREECLAEMMLDSGKTRKECKTDVIVAMYNNGKVFGYTGLKWFNEYKANIQVVQDEMAKDPEFQEAYKFAVFKKKDKPEHKKNVAGSLCSIIMNQYENEILTWCEDFLKNYKGLDTDYMVYVFDGFQYDKGVLNDTILREMEEFIYKQTGWKMDFIFKPMEEIIPLPNSIPMVSMIRKNNPFIYDEDDLVVVTGGEDEAGRLFYKHVIQLNRIKYCLGDWFVKQDERVWDRGLDKVRRFLLKKCLAMNYKKRDCAGMLINYCQNLPSAKAIVEVALMHLETDKDSIADNNFVQQMRLKNHGKLVWKNGVYDFRTKAFQKDAVWDTFVYIDRNFPEEEMVQEKKYITDKILDPVLRHNKKHFLHHQARAIAGHVEDKVFSCTTGETDSSKSTFVDMTKRCFGEYVQTAMSKNLAVKKFDDDPEKALGWLVPLQFARIIMISECEKNTTWNGVLMKMIVSGGDAIKARQLFKDPIEFVLDGTLMVVGNDIPKIDVSDVRSRMLSYSCCAKFVNTEEEVNKHEGYFYLKDPQLKQKVMEERYLNAWFQLIAEAYTTTPCVASDDMQFEIDEAVPDNIEEIMCLFNITKNLEDYITNEEVRCIYEYNGLERMGYSFKKVTDMLVSRSGGKRKLKKVKEGDEWVNHRVITGVCKFEKTKPSYD